MIEIKPTKVTFNIGDAPLPAFTGELVGDLLGGSVILEARFDGQDWHLLLDRPIKLKDCKGREDETWKYATYKTLDNGKFYHASSYNYTPREMRKKFDADYWEARLTNKRVAEARR